MKKYVVSRYKSNNWAVHECPPVAPPSAPETRPEEEGQLVCVCLYKRGAKEVQRRLANAQRREEEIEREVMERWVDRTVADAVTRRRRVREAHVPAI